ncbi:YdiU family protein [Alteromonas sp. 1_MG-2023]|uniref:protein adenylyltransferase SelO n=1 Tax=Alteromonas sp. 1_MG-2023 TaxID=3062669 RepID=UPI0026E3E93E|nr:YdiU family protein [Alteromonas sp. 1_MG-2023]MDO6566623.1 YdiU family protein [Alteromonas sp. 1_MG-2023]
MGLLNRYAETLTGLGSFVLPEPLKDMQVGLFNTQLANELALPDDLMQPQTMLDWLYSPVTPLTQHAFAQKYGGHQFGQWNPELGDGRGLLLAETTDSQGHPQDLHLKGAGPTPYSRHADGRAVLRSTLREYIGGEALHSLGIPSSRSLCLFTSSDTVYRERPETGAMMIRTAPSHIRFGHFEYYFYSSQTDNLQSLLDFTIEHHFPECKEALNPYASLLKAVVSRTARLVALWQTHGFVHGVMNTDNMSIHGITFDYGPYAFLDTYESEAVFNHSDHQGRYAFNQQPGIALWNLNALAHAFSGHCSIDEIKAALSTFESTFITQYQHLMLSRMGLEESEQEPSLALMQSWLQILETQSQDYTYNFRQLALADINNIQCPFRDTFVDREKLDAWWETYRELRLAKQGQSQLLSLNPAVIPRTHLLQQAIALAEKDDFSLAEALLEAASTPFDTKWDIHPFSKPPASTSHTSLSCSS